MPQKSSYHESDPQLLSALVCPVTGGPLIHLSEACELISLSAKLAFPIRDGIPIMVVSEARELEDAEIRKLARG